MKPKDANTGSSVSSAGRTTANKKTTEKSAPKVVFVDDDDENENSSGVVVVTDNSSPAPSGAGDNKSEVDRGSAVQSQNGKITTKVHTKETKNGAKIGSSGKGIGGGSKPMNHSGQEDGEQGQKSSSSQTAKKKSGEEAVSGDPDNLEDISSDESPRKEARGGELAGSGQVQKSVSHPSDTMVGSNGMEDAEMEDMTEMSATGKRKGDENSEVCQSEKAGTKPSETSAPSQGSSGKQYEPSSASGLKMAASKSTGVARLPKPTRNNDSDTASVSGPTNSAPTPASPDDDDRKPAAIEKDTPPGMSPMQAKMWRVRQFKDGSPKRHQIKASKMHGVNNSKTAAKSSEGSNDDAIVLSSSEEEDLYGEEKSGTNKPGSNGARGDGKINSRMDGDSNNDEPGDLDPETDAKQGNQDDNNGDQSNSNMMTKQMGVLGPRELEVGARVYCEFSANKRYYWGRILAKEKKKFSRYFKYHVRFDDGDEEKGVSSTKMWTDDEFQATFGDKTYQDSLKEAEAGTPSGRKPLPPGSSATATTTAAAFNGLSTEELLKRACGDCENCKRPACGSCGTCKANRFGGVQRCCLQKMCLDIPEQLKVQTCKELPDNLGFFFLDRDANPQYEGLVVISKGGRKYRSFENSMPRNRPEQKNIGSFYAYVGLKDHFKQNAPKKPEPRTASAPSEPPPLPPKRKQSGGPCTPHDLWNESCKKCANCLKPDCMRCICCRGNKRDGSAWNCCYQKMCLAIDIGRRAQQAPAGFPDGWKFAFDVPRVDLPQLQGLVLFPPPPNSRKYASVGRAMNHNKLSLAKVDKSLFYSCVGLPPDVSEGHAAVSTSTGQGQVKRPGSFVAQPAQLAKRAKPSPLQVIGGLSLRQLYERRCKTCFMCRKPSCTACQACKDNASLTRPFKDVCFQKMCCEIDDDDKVHPARGFPEGWQFYYTDPRKLAWHTSDQHTGLAGLVLLSPTDRRYESVEAAAVELSPSADVPTIARTFYAFVGCHAVVGVQDHILLGRSFRQKWIDVEGRTKMVYGNIVDVREDLLSGGIHTFTVQFNQKSRQLGNSCFAANGASIPLTQKIPETIAIGGCLDFDPSAFSNANIPFHLSWQVPDVRHEDFVVDEEGMWAPRLTLQFRGFHIVLTAKTSTIPNAGKGVFVSCSSLIGTRHDVFELKGGELLDLGVYAPFRRADKKSSHVFLLKNFLHNSMCEEWNFDTVHDDNLFDITDDSTGKLHEIASRHIPAYVNEVDSRSMAASVYAQHDPEGCVHYLLGHSNPGEGPFTLQANGVEKEIFIDYGETYEDVRIRKNYSRLASEQVAKRKRELDDDYREVLQEIKTYNAAEIIECVDFIMNEVIQPNQQYRASLVVRTLLVTVLFKKQAESFLEDFAATPVEEGDDNNDNESVCPNGFSRHRMEQLVEKANHLIHKLFKFSNSWYQLKQIIVSNPVHLNCLEFVLGDAAANYEDMPPEELGTLIIGK